MLHGHLAKFRQPFQASGMSTMIISLPDSLKSFADEQVAQRSYGTRSEYVRELISRDQDRQHLRALLLAGAASPAEGVADSAYFSTLRDRVRGPARGG
jgi:antitoxin ParD1/3/4